MELSPKDLYAQMVPAPYDWMLRRLEAAEARLQHLLTLAPTIALAIALATAAIAGPGNVKANWLGGTALGILALAMLFGGYARSYGFVQLLNFSELKRSRIDRANPNKVKWNAIDRAGKALKANLDLVRRKARYADYMSGMLFAGASFGIAWAVSVIGGASPPCPS